MKTCASCPTPAKCKAAGKCLKGGEYAYGGKATKKMNKGGYANCGASVSPNGKSKA